MEILDTNTFDSELRKIIDSKTESIRILVADAMKNGSCETLVPDKHYSKTACERVVEMLKQKGWHARWWQTTFRTAIEWDRKSNWFERLFLGWQSPITKGCSDVECKGTEGKTG